MHYRMLTAPLPSFQQSATCWVGSFSTLNEQPGFANLTSRTAACTSISHQALPAPLGLLRSCICNHKGRHLSSYSLVAEILAADGTAAVALPDLGTAAGPQLAYENTATHHKRYTRHDKGIIQGPFKAGSCSCRCWACWLAVGRAAQLLAHLWVAGCRLQ